MSKKIPVLMLGDAPEKDRETWHIWDKSHTNCLIIKASFQELVSLIKKVG